MSVASEIDALFAAVYADLDADAPREALGAALSESWIGRARRPVGETGGHARQREPERPAMDWIVLIVAGVLEVAWSLGLKYHGFTRPVPSVITGPAIVVSMLLLARAARTLPIGTAYAVWVGIGVVGAAIGGVVLFDEAMRPLRVVFLALLVVSIIGLKLTSAA